MTEKTTSQPQHNASQSQQPQQPRPPGVDGYRKLIDEQMARMGAAFAEIDLLESRALEQARTAVEAGARLFQESLVYIGQLGAEWRRMAMDTGRQVADRFAETAGTASQAASNAAGAAARAATTTAAAPTPPPAKA